MTGHSLGPWGIRVEVSDWVVKISEPHFWLI
jgi:hypothetical protein